MDEINVAIGQLNHAYGILEDGVSPIERITDIDLTKDRRVNDVDKGITSLDSAIEFFDECLTLDGEKFSAKQPYYCHCQIKRLGTPQKFFIKLCKYEPDTEEDNIQQYIKTIVIQAAKKEKEEEYDVVKSEWVDVEFMFTPLAGDFDCILFQLQRTSEDYVVNKNNEVTQRYPKIIYQELGTITNLITESILANVENPTLYKLGVQAAQDFEMCINGEEIHVPRNGVYEIKNGVIPITFLGVSKIAVENDNNPLESGTVAFCKKTIDTEYRAYETGNYSSEDIKSASCLGTDKITYIDSFVMDYMYHI